MPKFIQQYRSDLQQIPDFKHWLQPGENYGTKAYCKYCECDMIAKLYCLKQHKIMTSVSPSAGAASAPPSPPAALSAAQRARAERNRLRARTLRDARLVTQPAPACVPATSAAALPTDSGGGFLLEPGGAGVAGGAGGAGGRVALPRPAPLQPPLQPACLDCGRKFPASYLLDTFQYAVCDDCRDEEGAHELLTRTEAKTEFLLKDCDLDLRGGALPCVRRKNPHRGARSDMRLYLRAQVEARALEVWGSEQALEDERAAREEKKVVRGVTRGKKRLRELRMAVRSSLYRTERTAHAHRWGDEEHLPGTDDYQRRCLDCDHTETYEKM